MGVVINGAPSSPSRSQSPHPLSSPLPLQTVWGTAESELESKEQNYKVFSVPEIIGNHDYGLGRYLLFQYLDPSGISLG